MQYEQISGKDAMQRMRNLRMLNHSYFTLIHISCNQKTGECGEIRKCERCKLRKSLPANTFEINGDHYLPYEDLDTGEPRMCFKKLIRFVAFPPDYKLLKVNWFNG